MTGSYDGRSASSWLELHRHTTDIREAVAAENAARDLDDGSAQGKAVVGVLVQHKPTREIVTA